MNQSIIIANPIVAVLVIDVVDSAVPTARALASGGVMSIELTLRTEAAIDAIREIRKNVPEITVGAGTVIFPEQVRDVVDAGAHFAVAPGFQSSVAKAALAAELPFAPGVAVPSDVENALSLGFRVLKFYPAESMGGVSYLKAMAAPYAYLQLQFLPLGGVNMANIENYLSSPLIAAVGGSWIAKRDLIKAANWQQITKNAREAVSVASRLRGEAG